MSPKRQDRNVQLQHDPVGVPAAGFDSPYDQPMQNLIDDLQLVPSFSGSSWPPTPESMGMELSVGDSVNLPQPMPQRAVPAANMQYNFMPKRPVPNEVLPHNIISNGTQPHNMVPHGIQPHNIMPEGASPHGLISNSMVPDMIDPQVPCFGAQDLIGAPLLNSPNNPQQAYMEFSEGFDSSDYSRSNSIDMAMADGNVSGMAPPCGPMQAPPIQFAFRHAPAPYPVAPRPGHGLVARNHRNRYAPAQYGGQTSSSSPELDSAALTEAEQRRVSRRASHNVVEKRYRKKLNTRYDALEAAIKESQCSFPVAGGCCPGSAGKAHAEIAPTKLEKEEDTLPLAGTKPRRGQSSPSKAEIIVGATERIQQLVDEVHMLKMKLAMPEASHVAGSQQTLDELDGVRADENTNVQDTGKDVKMEV